MRAGAGSRVSVGDRVALLWRPRCGECEACVAGNPVLCRFGRVLATTNGLMDGTTRLHSGEKRIHHLMGVSCFAERVVVSVTSVLPLPDEVPPEIAAISACAVITGVGAVLNAVHGATGQPFAIFGSGGVGLAAVMGAALIGANPVIAIDIDAAKLELERIVGALYGSSNPRLDLPRIFALYLAGRLPLDKLIGGRRPLAEVNEACAELRAGGVGRTILLP